MKFRVPELFLGAFLAIAVFSMGMLFSSEHPAPITAPLNTEEAHNSLETKDGTKSSWRGVATDPIAALTLGLVLVGLFQAGLFYVQLKLIRESLTDAKMAANAAKDGAKAARDSADTSKVAMVASERAYVHFTGCRYISHRAHDESPVFWRLRPIWINSGNTPTRGLFVYAHYELLDEPLPSDYEFIPAQHDPILSTIYPDGKLESAARDIDGTDLVEVKEGRKYLYVWGVAKYRDVFAGTPERVTKFCVMATNIAGNPTLPWDDKANIFEIAFTTFGRHNCSDEDCDQSG
jgi:hypothetical protein